MDNRQNLDAPCIHNIVDCIRKTSYDGSANFPMHDRTHFWIMLKSAQDFINAQSKVDAQALTPNLVPMMRILQIQFGLWA